MEIIYDFKEIGRRTNAISRHILAMSEDERFGKADSRRVHALPSSVSVLANGQADPHTDR